MQNDEFGCLPTPYMKINSKWITDLNLRAKVIKSLKENRINVWDFWLSNNFLDITPKAQEKNEKN